MEVISIDEFRARCQAQGVRSSEHLAFKCPICGTVQSATSLIRAIGAGATFEAVRDQLGFSCVGRFTAAGPHQPDTPPGRGCDWTLGGLFRLHKLEVIHMGQHVMHFAFATPEEAQALQAKHDQLQPATAGVMEAAR